LAEIIQEHLFFLEVARKDSCNSLSNNP